MFNSSLKQVHWSACWGQESPLVWGLSEMFFYTGGAPEQKRGYQLVGFNPFEKNMSQSGIISPGRPKNQKSFETTT